MCPLTSMIKGYAFEVAVTPDMHVSGVVLADQVRSLDWLARETEYIRTRAPRAVQEVLSKVAALLSS